MYPFLQLQLSIVAVSDGFFCCKLHSVYLQCARLQRHSTLEILSMAEFLSCLNKNWVFFCAVFELIEGIECGVAKSFCCRSLGDHFLLFAKKEKKKPKKRRQKIQRKPSYNCAKFRSLLCFLWKLRFPRVRSAEWPRPRPRLAPGPICAKVTKLGRCVALCVCVCAQTLTPACKVRRSAWNLFIPQLGKGALRQGLLEHNEARTCN